MADLNDLGALLPTLLPLIAAGALYLQRENRTARAETRKLRRLVEDFELRTVQLERGWISRGYRPPPIPTHLEALRAYYRSDDPDRAPDPAPDDAPDRGDRPEPVDDPQPRRAARPTHRR